MRLNSPFVGLGHHVIGLQSLHSGQLYAFILAAASMAALTLLIVMSRPPFTSALSCDTELTGDDHRAGFQKQPDA
jgi:hypothetical protein